MEQFREIGGKMLLRARVARAEIIDVGCIEFTKLQCFLRKPWRTQVYNCVTMRRPCSLRALRTRIAAAIPTLIRLALYHRTHRTSLTRVRLCASRSIASEIQTSPWALVALVFRSRIISTLLRRNQSRREPVWVCR